MSFIEMYYYIFYKYYKLSKALNTKAWTPDMIAVLIMMNLLMFVIFPIQFYYDIFSGRRGVIPFLSVKFILVLIFILLIQWFAFWRNDNWTHYVEQFDKWPINKNKRGGWIVAAVTIFLLANFIISLVLDPPPGGWR